ncbi:MAG: response regulator [Thermoproteota archaeon]|nr:response regulator [Thermoproteota archaeon]
MEKSGLGSSRGSTIDKSSLDPNNHGYSSSALAGTSNGSIPYLKVKDKLKEENQDKKETVSFIEYSQRYCIGFIDIINSTIETAKIRDPKKLRMFYTLFLNTMAAVIDEFNGKIIKNSGDNLFFYFPKTSDPENEPAFHECLECGTEMVESKSLLEGRLLEESLPPIGYRISMDYGEVEIAISVDSKAVDLFGSVVNECAKMNYLLSSTSFIIGESLYNKSITAYFSKSYRFNEIKEYQNKKHTGKAYRVMKEKYSEHEPTLKNFPTQDAERQFTKRGNNSNHNVMIIDDDEDILYTFQAILKGEGYNVDAFSRSTDAFKHFTENKAGHYDLILLDIRMPGLSGIQLYYRIKAVNPYANILFISALEVVEELVDALPGLSIKDILKKPIESKEFLEKVRSKINVDSHGMQL